MSRTAQKIPGLYGGISQQAPATRRPSQCEDQINCMSTIVDGVSKRPPSQHVARVMDRQLGEASVHTINRDLRERYTVIITDGDIQVFEAETGVERVVGFTNGNDYLRSNRPRTGFSLITVADFTFVVNKDVTVRQDDNKVTTGSVNKHVQDFSDVTRIDDPFEGQIVEVAGDDNSSFDNYWVRREAGVWRECARPNIVDGFDESTMPHVLIRTASGDFSFQPADWPRRGAGDNEIGSNPFPSFVDKTVSDVFFHRNRIGFVSASNVCMSRSGEFFNFWRDTVTDLLDTDPIDVAASHTSVATLRYAIPFNETLLLMADQTQFVLNGGDVLSPNTVSIDVSTEFQTFPDVKPVGAGPNVYFPVITGQYAAVREYYVQPDTVTNDAEDITSHVPRFVPQTVFRIEAATNEDMLFLLASNEPSTIYVYNYYWSGQQKQQSAWGRWEMSGNILSVSVLDSDLYLLIEHEDGIYIERVGLQDQAKAPSLDFDIMLDRRVHIAATGYDSETDTTRFELPYDITDQDISVVPDGSWDSQRAQRTQTVRRTRTSVDVRGNWSQRRCFVGVPYEQRYVFNEIFPREGQNESAIARGRLQLQYFTVYFSQTGYFRFEVVRAGRVASPIEVSPAVVDPRTGRVVGRADLTLGTPSVNDGEARMPVMANSRYAQIVLVNDSHLPSTFALASWEGDLVLPERL